MCTSQQIKFWIEVELWHAYMAREWMQKASAYQRRGAPCHMYGDDRSLDLRSSLPDASVAERRQVEAKARSRKAKHDEREQDSHRALAGPVLRPDEHRALADVTVTNAHHRGQSAPLPTGGYVPVDVNHASLSAPVGVSIGAAGTAGGAVAHDGASPSPLQADDVELWHAYMAREWMQKASAYQRR